MSVRREMEDQSTNDIDSALPSLGFDYSSVPSPVANFLKGQADRIRRQCVTSIIQIGKALLEAKRHLSHGAFLLWVEREVCMPVRTAQAYMRVAQWASAKKNAIVAHLSPTMLYLLSAPSTPDNFVTDILTRVEAGESIAPSVMRKELKALRSIKRLDDGSATGATAIQTPASMKSEEAEVGNDSSGGLDELVEILIERLTAEDFERVRRIMTGEAVLYDPELPQNLGRAFMIRADTRSSVAVSAKSHSLR
jgi:hypothetical protein